MTESATTTADTSAHDPGLTPAAMLARYEAAYPYPPLEPGVKLVDPLPEGVFLISGTVVYGHVYGSDHRRYPVTGHTSQGQLL